MTTHRTIIKISAGLCVLFTAYCCTSSSHEHGSSAAHHHSFTDKIKTSNDTIHYSVTSAAVMDQMKTVLAQIHDTVSFLIPERTSQILSFPCASCHSKPVEQLKLKKTETKNSHWDLKLVHGSEEVMDCFTCHNKNNLEELISLTGHPILFDESYKQCSQCHSTQYKDWIGGSHGKRIGGWAPPRIINSCVNCHNPHKPAFETRLPSWLNTVSKSKN